MARNDGVQEGELVKPKKLTSLKAVVTDKLIVDSNVEWYNVEKRVANGSIVKLNNFEVTKLFEKAEALIKKDNDTYYQEFSANSSQKNFLNTMLNQGTLNDKISSLSLLVTESPIHNLKSITNLLEMCDKKNRNASLQCINVINDLLINNLLPEYKLSYFKDLVHKDDDDKTLIVLYFQDFLKKFFFKYLMVLERLLNDSIVFVRMNTIQHVFDLLASKPEQEYNLLKLLINKLGDNDNKVCSKSSYLLLQLQQQHPMMKKIVIENVVDLLYKSKDYHTIYYSILVLNQTILLREDIELADLLIKNYLNVFEKILLENHKIERELTTAEKAEKEKEAPEARNKNRKTGKKGKKGGKSVKQVVKSDNELIEEKQSKIFTALLTGINRSLPFSSKNNELLIKNLNNLYKIIHSTNFNTSVQALILIYQISKESPENLDRYYRSLYESLLDTRLINSSKQGIYLNLLYKSLKDDSDLGRIMAFIKRILQNCANWLNIGSIVGMSYLLIELFSLKPDLKSIIDDEKLEEDIYDGKKRDPKFANANTTKAWEWTFFANHYHPTISVYANSLVDGTQQAKPNLTLFTLSHFLDRFVYKNAKEKVSVKNASIMQPLSGVHGLLIKENDKQIPINTEQWLKEKIRPDEEFFYNYFITKQDKLKEIKKNKKKTTGEDGEEDELDDEEVWQALVKSNPDVEEEDGDLDDEDLSDLDDEDDEDDEDLDGEIDDEELDEDSEDLEAGEFDEELEVEDEELEGQDSSDDEEARIFQDEDDDEFDDEEEAVEEKEEEKEESSRKRRKLKDLPVFADADAYAQYLQSDDEDDL